jgi:transposase InsO family protein
MFSQEEPRMNVHQNARLTPQGRAQLVQRVARGEPVRTVAGAVGVTERTVRKWVSRWRAEPTRALGDRSSRPQHSPRATPPAVIDQVVALRQQRWTGAQIASWVGISRATAGRLLRARGLARLRALEPPPPVQRYERAAPGELLHVDTKKLGRILRPGHRVTGTRRGRPSGAGWEYAHVCVDDASRLAYVEVLPDERSETAQGFLRRAVGWLATLGVPVQRVMTDNGSPYIAHAFGALCQRLGVRQLRTRPYTPRTNGKAERFIQTLLRQWAYGRVYPSSAQRRALLSTWLHYYNVHRGHTSLAGRPPVSRLLTADNLVSLHT